jgi:predicted acylesterase/phospholipase RssA
VLVEDGRLFRGRHLIAHSLNIRLRHRFNRILATQSGLIPARLAQLESASFERLHHGVRAIGIVCHDRGTRQPWYFSTGQNHGARLSDVVRASASIPYLFPSIAVDSECGSLQLTDGGITDCLPIAFAEQPPLSATHLIVSDCRWLSARAPEPVEHLVYIRPPLFTTGTVWAPSSTLAETVEQGARAVTDEMIERIRNWGYGAPDFLIPSTDGRSTADCLSTL